MAEIVFKIAYENVPLHMEHCRGTFLKETFHTTFWALKYFHKSEGKNHSDVSSERSVTGILATLSLSYVQKCTQERKWQI